MGNVTCFFELFASPAQGQQPITGGKGGPSTSNRPLCLSGAGLARLVMVLGFATLVLRTGSALAADQPAMALPIICDKPDMRLIKQRGTYPGRVNTPDLGSAKLYNSWQVLAFNDCMKKLVDTVNANMARVRDDANTTVKAMAETANRQTKDIAEKVRAAIAGQTPSPEGQVELAGWQYPSADCIVPDKVFLKPPSGKKNTSASAAVRFDAQQRDYRACVQAYIKQAGAEMLQIEASANAQIKGITDRARARMGELSSLKDGAIEAANHAAKDEIAAVRSASLDISPANTFKDGVENKAVNGQPPLEQAETPKGDGDPHAIVCRKPQWQLLDLPAVGTGNLQTQLGLGVTLQ